MKNKFKVFTLLFVFFFSIVLLHSNDVYAGNLKLKNLDFQVLINEDASMDVIERWNIRIEDTNTLFKNFNTDDNKFSNIENVSVKDITNNKEFTKINEEMYHVTKNCFYAMDISSYKYEIAWGIGMDNSSGTREYEIKYTVKDAVALHNDCAELYWKFIGEDFEVPSENITGTIHLPGNLLKEDIKVWGHTRSLNGIINSTDEGTIVFNLEQIPSNDYVEIRATFPKDVISSSKRTDSVDALDSIVAEETRWADKANKRRENEKKMASTITLVLGIVVCAAGIVQLLYPIKVMKEADAKIVPLIDYDYFRELPREDATPAEAVTLINKSTSTAILDFGKVFSATLMDLNLKKFIGFEVGKNEKGKEIITIKLKEDAPEVETLKKDEALIYSFVKKAIESKKKDSITMPELQKYIQIHSTSVSSLIQKVNTAETSFLKENEYINKDQIAKRDKLTALEIIIFAIMFFGIIFTFASEMVNITPLIVGILIGYGVATMLGWILSFIAASKLNVHTQKGVDEIDKWEALKKFMSDFSQMDKKDLPSIVLWEHYLVYATAFGIADKVIKQLKLVYPELNDDLYFNTYGYSAMYIATHTDFSNSFSGAISSSISTATSSGSGAGGGFSGGGGFGGGGGGGGGR